MEDNNKFRRDPKKKLEDLVPKTYEKLNVEKDLYFKLSQDLKLLTLEVNSATSDLIISKEDRENLSRNENHLKNQAIIYQNKLDQIIRENRSIELTVRHSPVIRDLTWAIEREVKYKKELEDNYQICFSNNGYLKLGLLSSQKEGKNKRSELELMEQNLEEYKINTDKLTKKISKIGTSVGLSKFKENKSSR